ncbi:hypothetical protein LILAB_03945 [Corallococcus macrosporus]|uniref:Uncharacterized protein n=1 Tax=Myxococcus fulvus (strain ATCC BAA-855 / HW-1) TaxID=483219 RepID=F8CKP9_MYXFH|nr:hypothetical protein LILAB_03945 [Corallococcus macrosporus]
MGYMLKLGWVEDRILGVDDLVFEIPDVRCVQVEAIDGPCEIDSEAPLDGWTSCDRWGTRRLRGDLSQLVENEVGRAWVERAQCLKHDFAEKI